MIVVRGDAASQKVAIYLLRRPRSHSLGYLSTSDSELQNDVPSSGSPLHASGAAGQVTTHSHRDTWGFHSALNWKIEKSAFMR